MKEPEIYCPRCEWRPRAEDRCLVLDGVYRGTGDEVLFQEARAPTPAELQGLLEKIIARLMKMLTRQGYLVEEQGVSYFADIDADTRAPGGLVARYWVRRRIIFQSLYDYLRIEQVLATRRFGAIWECALSGGSWPCTAPTRR